MSAFSEVYDHGAWRVVHTLSSGHVYERGVQYDLRDATASFNDGSTKPTWIGVLRRNSSISMTGSLGMRGATLTYDETMTQNGQIIMASELTCRLDGSWQTPAPPPIVGRTGRAAHPLRIVEPDRLRDLLDRLQSVLEAHPCGFHPQPLNGPRRRFTGLLPERATELPEAESRRLGKPVHG